MAFSVNALVERAEVRKVVTGVSKKSGAIWCSLRCEDTSGEPFEVSVDSEIIDEVERLKKGDLVDLYCLFVGNREYQFARCLSFDLLGDE